MPLGKVFLGPPADRLRKRMAIGAQLRKDKRGVDLISDALAFGRLWYGEPNAVSSGPGRAGRRMIQASQADLDISSGETEKIRACIVNPSPFKIVV